MAVTFEWYHESGYLTLNGKKAIKLYGGGNCDVVGVTADGGLRFFISNLTHAKNCADLFEEDWFINNKMTLHLNTFDKRSTYVMLQSVAKMKKAKVVLYNFDWTKTRRYKIRMKAIKEGE